VHLAAAETVREVVTDLDLETPSVVTLTKVYQCVSFTRSLDPSVSLIAARQ